MALKTTIDLPDDLTSAVERTRSCRGSSEVEVIRAATADTSGLLAYFDPAEPTHAHVREVLDRSTEPLVISPYMIAELTYLVLTRLGVDSELAVLTEIAVGADDLTAMSNSDNATACTVVERHRDQTIEVADASIVVLANRYRTHMVLTLDHRHVNVLRPLDGGHSDVVP